MTATTVADYAARIVNKLAASVLVVMALGVARGSTAEWSVLPPAGWRDTSAQAQAMPAIAKQAKELAARGGSMTVASYRGTGSDQLTVTVLRTPGAGGSPRWALRELERGVRDGMHGSASDAHYRLTEVDNTLVVDDTVTLAGHPTRCRRIYGRTATGVLAAIATCTGPDTACDPALASLGIDHTGLAPLTDDADAHGSVDSRSSSYQAGYLAGRIALPVLAILALLYFLLRRR